MAILHMLVFIWVPLSVSIKQLLLCLGISLILLLILEALIIMMRLFRLLWLVLFVMFWY